jgi:CubicO group peptidase (beta-lactamase class C family)
MTKPLPVRFALIAVPMMATLALINCSNRSMSNPTADKIDQLFAKWNKPDSPGCSVGISRNGQLVYERGYGVANLELNAPITPESVFEAASISKQFTTFHVLGAV